MKWTLSLYSLLITSLALLLQAPLYASDSTELAHPACQYGAVTDINVVRFYADLDGVDGKDTFVADRRQGTTIITACDYANHSPWDMGDANKPLSIVVADIEGDGKDELILGGPTATSPFTGSVKTLKRGQLQSEDYVAFQPATEYMNGKTSGCDYLDSGDRRSIVNYRYTKNADQSLLSWVSDDQKSGAFKLPNEATRAWLFRSGLCGNQVLMNYEVMFRPGNLKSHLTPGTAVSLGINNQLLEEKTAEELLDSANWQIAAEYYAGYEGPFLLQPLMERGQKILVGEHNHCAGGPLPPPMLDEDGLIQLSLQPSHSDSCLNWFAVDLWVRADFSIVAIILNIWEP